MHHHAIRTAPLYGESVPLRILIHTHICLQLPSKATVESPKKNNTNKFIRKKGSNTANVTTSSVGTTDATSSRSIPDAINASSLPSLDTTYPPDIQCDYGGNIFEHQHARLRQLPVYDTEGNLVPTHEMWNQLCPGTLVTLNADLVCWVYNDDDKRRMVSFKKLIKQL